MDEIIQIKCPFDGAVLSVKYQPGMESRTVTCPVCKHKYPFVQYTRVTPASGGGDQKTQYPKDSGATQYANESGATQYANIPGEAVLPKENYTLGKVNIVGTGISFQLQPGRNVIGRKSVKSSADFQIDTGDKRAMSREHIVIEIKKEPLKGFVHYLSLYKEKVNKTFLEQEQIVFGDSFVLSHGNIIKLPDATLKFIIPDGDETDI